MNLFLYELKSSWKSMAVWIISIIGFLIFCMSMFPSFSSNVTAMDDLLANFSPEMIKALGMDIIDFSKPMDYLAYMYQYMLVAVGALAILMGGNILAKEEADKTIEFLYAKPISRNYMVIAKISAAVTNMVIMAVSFWLSTVVTMMLISDNVDHSSIIKVSVGLLLFMIYFLSIGLVLGFFVVKAGKRLPIGLGLLFFMYFISIMSDVNEKFEVMKYMTPYQYYSRIELIHKGFDGLYLVLTLVVIIVGVALTWFLYLRKDLNT